MLVRLIFFKISYNPHQGKNTWLISYNQHDADKSSNLPLLKSSVNQLTSDIHVFSFWQNSSFTNKWLLTNYKTKLSNLDIMLIKSSNSAYQPTTLFRQTLLDNYTNLSQNYSYVTSLFRAEFSDKITSFILTNPELIISLESFNNSYFVNNTSSYTVASFFDCYTSNMNLTVTMGYTNFLLLMLVSLALISVFLSNILVNWLNLYNAPSIRLLYYIYSKSKRLKFQFEAFIKSVVYLFTYWSIVLITSHDTNINTIEYVDTMITSFFLIVTLYLVCKHSIHYLSFLEGAVIKGKPLSSLFTSFVKDTLNVFLVLLRFSLLIFRINVYDVFDDFLDSYYILLDDFNDTEYLHGIFTQANSLFNFSPDNRNNKSFLMNEENDFHYDGFYLYFLSWSTLVYFLTYAVEEALRMTLSLVIIYNIIFELNVINCTYKEDSYITKKFTNKSTINHFNL